jgi:hypothetical protein
MGVAHPRTQEYDQPMMKRITLTLALIVGLALTGCTTTTTAGTTVANTPAASSASPTPTGPTLTTSQQQAVIAAKGYLTMGSGFSYQGLIDQLSSSAGSGFSVADATAAVTVLNVDYNAQAVLSAQGYMKIGGFSHASLVEQLSSAAGAQFTPAQAEYAATKVGL